MKVVVRSGACVVMVSTGKCAIGVSMINGQYASRDDKGRNNYQHPFAAKIEITTDPSNQHGVIGQGWLLGTPRRLTAHNRYPCWAVR